MASLEGGALVEPDESLDETVRTWLRLQHFQEGDLHSEANLDYFGEMTPMARACLLGNLRVCKWLHSHGAADDVTRPGQEGGETPMHWACHEGHLHACKWLYETGAAEDVTSVDFYGITPMLISSEHGHLSVCKWLYEMGAADDITRANTDDGATPMSGACKGGHLPTCKWLHSVGAPITTEDARGTTLMAAVCRNGHLDVCKWLYEVGAAEDLTKANTLGETPMSYAYSHFIVQNSQRAPVCEWLVFNGALNRPTPAGHVDQAVVERGTRYGNGVRRPALLAWAQGIVADHRALHDVFLVGTFSARRCSAHLWMLNEQGRRLHACSRSGSWSSRGGGLSQGSACATRGSSRRRWWRLDRWR